MAHLTVSTTIDSFGTVRNQLLNSFVSIGGITCMTLTFFHSIMWVPVLLFSGLALLLITPLMLTRMRCEPPAFIVALIWIAMAISLAFAYGASEQFYNTSQIAFLILGFLLGYVVSITHAPNWAAWSPFILFATYCASMILLGRDPGEALTRNSRNFVSVIMLGLYASAILVSKPLKVTPLHLTMALVTLLVSIWSTGRGGIVTALLLNFGLFTHVLLRGRFGVIRSISVIFTMLALGIVAYAGSEFLQNQGYLNRLAQRGLQDAPRLAMIVAYFQNIQPVELIFGQNYYDNSYLARYDFNLHNSYLSAWAHLGLCYLLFILGTLAVAARHTLTHAVIVIPLMAFAVRAFTDTQLIGAKYDYVFIATLFILIRKSASQREFSRVLLPSPALAHRKFA